MKVPRWMVGQEIYKDQEEKGGLDSVCKMDVVATVSGQEMEATRGRCQQRVIQAEVSMAMDNAADWAIDSCMALVKSVSDTCRSIYPVQKAVS